MNMRPAAPRTPDLQSIAETFEPESMLIACYWAKPVRIFMQEAVEPSKHSHYRSGFVLILGYDSDYASALEVSSVS
jgi:hypothetical protein